MYVIAPERPRLTSPPVLSGSSARMFNVLYAYGSAFLHTPPCAEDNQRFMVSISLTGPSEETLYSQ